MPSPFPGMDPYLEGELWQEFHETLAGAMRAQLMPWLRPKYVALLAKRYVLDYSMVGVLDLPPPRVFFPDVHVVAPPEAAEATNGPRQGRATPPTLEVASPMPVPQLSIEIRDVAQRRLVTLIEILSPANKRGGGTLDYAERRADLMRTSVHLLEIDLVRAGDRIALSQPVPPAPYYAYLSRRERRPWTQVWAIQIQDALPTVPVPLLPVDADVTLDLQAAVESCFELVGYDQLLPYDGPPPPPELAEADAAWLAATLQAAGVRT